MEGGVVCVCGGGGCRGCRVVGGCRCVWGGGVGVRGLAGVGCV